MVGPVAQPDVLGGHREGRGYTSDLVGGGVPGPRRQPVSMLGLDGDVGSVEPVPIQGVATVDIPMVEKSCREEESLGPRVASWSTWSVVVGARRSNAHVAGPWPPCTRQPRRA